MKKILSVLGKCFDCFSANYYTEDGQTDISYNGYVLSGLGIGSGDYLELDIDVETGQILNWVPLTTKDILKSFLKEEEDDE